MKRKKQLYEEMKALEHEFKELNSIVRYEDATPTEDEIHGWAIRMNAYIQALEELKKEVLEFYTS
jgi:hypothetical protein